MSQRTQPLRVGLAGLGLIGGQIAQLLHEKGNPELTLAAVTARDVDQARTRLAAWGIDAPVLPLADLVEQVDVVAEAAGAAALPEIAEAVMNAGKTLVCISAAGFLTCPDLLERVRAGGAGRIIVASGGVSGIDLVRAAGLSGLRSVEMESRFTPLGLHDSGYAKAKGIDLSQPLSAAVTVYDGPLEEAARLFPRNLNVGVSVMLALRGWADTRLRIVADPELTDQITRIEIDSEAGAFTLVNRHRFSGPYRGARIVAPSVVDALRRLVEPVTAGG